MNAVTPSTTRIGWIGAGVMGRSMAGHLMDAGYRLTVFNRTKAKATPLLDRGAQWADTPRAVAEASDATFSIVGNPDDVREVILSETGALAGASPGAVLVDMTTSEPSLAVEIAAAASARGAMSIDAPVSGGDIGAKNGTLSIMIGGDQQTAVALEPLWDALGSRWVIQGGPGAGQHTKMVNQTLVAGVMVGVCEALLYAYKAGLDLATVLESVSSGAAGSWNLSNLGPRIIAGDFEPGFYVEHFLKDMRIVLAESRRMNLAMPGLALCEQLYQATAAKGHARDGTHALMLALAEMSGVEWKPGG
ncbi:MAG: NAD(P)-dependent oxidoreductase [Planctomycetota bacterium]